MEKRKGLINLIKLKNEDYVLIQHNGVKSYGGNQSWWNKDNTVLCDHGCGIISMCDLELYLKKHTSFETMTYWEYKRYVDDASKTRYDMGIAKKRKDLGLVPMTMMRGLKGETDIRNSKIKWAPSLNSNKTKEYIIDMLSRDIPVVASYYVFNKNNKLNLCSYNIKSATMKSEKEIKAHYFNITGLAVYNQKEYLCISSWGKKYYINYDEWAEKLSFFSNILLIK